jgi:ABC-type sugar transport system ATPase subunit
VRRTLEADCIVNFIQFSRVTKHFGGRAVLREISLEIAQSERLVLWGPSGCGKTTILRLIAGLDTPDAGTIQIAGRIVAEPNSNVVQSEERNIGMVFQDLALWPHMTVKDNLMFGLRARRIPETDAAARIDSILKSVNLQFRLDAKPNQLSGGEQQRVALARALVLRPSILLMDEPLSSLDEGLKQQIVSDVLNFHRDLAFTLIYVTHDRTEAGAIASRVCKLSNGTLTQ